MKRDCPYCLSSKEKVSNHGHFVRASDHRMMARYYCTHCCKSFSQATFQQCYRQKKRKLHPRIRELINSTVSQRRIARILKISRTTVARKIKLLGLHSDFKNLKYFHSRSLVTHFQFDDLETFEHTKCKPLSITMAVETETRKIIGYEISRMPAKGKLAKIARKKYGYREDERKKRRDLLFKDLSQRVSSTAEI